jgi:hypothetical protein
MFESNQYVIGIDPITNCEGQSCTSIFLPGGLETERLRTNGLSQTFFDPQTTLTDDEMIMISGAPGYQLEFYQPQDYTFDQGDCFMDKGQGLQICIGSDNSTIFAGKLISSIRLS